MKKFLLVSIGILSGSIVATEHKTEEEAVKLGEEVLASGINEVWIYEGLYSIRPDFKVKKIPFTTGGRI